jgi:membrane protease YdiL (CAAX protease family)
LVVVLAAIWGLQTFQLHFGAEPLADESPQEEIALVYLDRTMRVADELAGWPGWVSGALGYGARSEELEELSDGLAQLHEAGSLSEDGDSALAVMAFELGEEPPDDLQAYSWVVALLADEAPPAGALEEVISRVLGGNAAWWEVALARRLDAQQRGAEVDRALAGEARKGQTLAWRSVVAAGLCWGLVLAGLSLVPRAWRQMRGGALQWDRAAPRSYPWRWALVLLLGVFVLTDLLSGFVVLCGYVVFSPEDGGAGIVLDTVMDLGWRLTAPALALLFLFRRPGHAVRTLRLNGPAAWTVVLAVFAVLNVVDLGVFFLFGRVEAPDPTGGLDALEAGWSGLVYALLTGCVAAPLVEEIMYRGILLRGLERRLRFFAAAAVVALVFALAHNYGLVGLVSVAIFGFSAAIVYRATNSLKAAILLHALYNLSVTLPTWWIYHARV